PSTSFQVNTPTLGDSIRARAISLTEDESNGCNIPSVAQEIITRVVIIIKRHSTVLILPASASSLVMSSRQPLISSISALKKGVITKYRIILIIIENESA